MGVAGVMRFQSGELARTGLWLAALLSAGCACVERGKAQQATQELRARSIERSAVTMQATAARLGATLLPERVQTWREPSQCSSEGYIGPVPCHPWWALAGTPAGRVEDPTGHWHQVIPVGDGGTNEYMRVARRGDTVFLLMPRVERHAVSRGAACECDGGPSIVVPTDHAFILDDFAVKWVQRIHVTVSEDYLDWDCKRLLVQDGRSRRNVAGAPRPSACE